MACEQSGLSADLSRQHSTSERRKARTWSIWARSERDGPALSQVKSGSSLILSLAPSQSSPSPLRSRRRHGLNRIFLPTLSTATSRRKAYFAPVHSRDFRGINLDCLSLLRSRMGTQSLVRFGSSCRKSVKLRCCAATRWIFIARQFCSHCPHNLILVDADRNRSKIMLFRIRIVHFCTLCIFFLELPCMIFRNLLHR